MVFRPSDTLPDGPALYQPLPDGLRVLVSWHYKRVLIQDAAANEISLPHIERHLRGPFEGFGAESPLQSGTVLDGWLVCPDLSAYEVQRALTDSKRYRKIRLAVADVATPGPYGWATRVGPKMKQGHRWGPTPPGRIARVVGGPVRAVPTGDRPMPGITQIARPVNAPYVYGKSRDNLLVRPE
jgi:hypothetical protein